MNTLITMKLAPDTASFLETLLFVSDSPDHEKRPFQNSTIYDFHPEFIAAVDSFVDRFREYLAANHPDMDPDAGNRSFGGNVYFSLSGHGCGFWDDRDSEWGDAMQSALVAFSDSLPGACGAHRFEFMDLSKHRAGKIDLAFLVQYLPERRREMFGMEEPAPAVQFPAVKALASALSDAKRHIDNEMTREDDSCPSIDVTLACGPGGYALQLGDNSYSGPAYSFPHWGVSSLYRRSNCKALARDLIEQCRDLAAQ
jgi:hypothetical protein